MRKFFSIAFLVIGLSGYAQQMPNTLSAADKVYGLSRFWQEVNYNFVYLDQVDRRMWDSTYREYITQVQATPNDYEYFRLLQRFCALLNDGHTNVYSSTPVNAMMYGKMFGKYWFGLEYIDGKAVVNRTLKALVNEIPIGTEVVSVNGLPATQYAKDSVEPYIASSTDYVRKRWAVQQLFYSPLGTPYDVTFKRPDGKEFSLHLVHERTTDTAFYPSFTNNPLLDLKWYPGKIAYLALNSFGDKKIDSMFLARLPELYEAKALIIDLRNNGGGSTNIGTDILQYFMKDTIMQHARYFTREHLAAYKAWGRFKEAKDTINNEGSKKSFLMYNDKYMYAFDYEPDTFHLAAKRLVVPTTILVSNYTASAAEDFLISAADQPHMTRIGERSFGSTGQPYNFSLGKGFEARVCTKKDTYPDGTQFVGVGIIPHIEVVPTVNDFIQQKDPVLDRALQYLAEKMK